MRTGIRGGGGEGKKAERNVVECVADFDRPLIRDVKAEHVGI